jgi:hypothetical protein
MDGAGGTGSNTEDCNGIEEKGDGGNKPREISELMDGLTELDESIRDQDRDLAALGAGGNEGITTPKAPSSDMRAGWWVGGWVGVLGFRPATGVGGWVRKMGFVRLQFSCLSRRFRGALSAR